MRVGLPHLAGRDRLRVSLFSPLGWRCFTLCMEGLRIRARQLIIPVGATRLRSCPVGQLSPRTGSLSHRSQQISKYPAVLGFPHLTGLYLPGRCRFSPPDGWSCNCCKERFMIRRWDLIVPGCGGTWTFSRDSTIATPRRG